MASEWGQLIAQSVLAKAIRLRPSSLVNDIADPKVLEEWAGCCDLIGKDLPKLTSLWSEAVQDWAVTEPNDRMFTPWSLKQAVTRVRNRWEADVEGRKVLAEYREEQQERKRALWNDRWSKGLSPLDGSPRQIER